MNTVRRTSRVIAIMAVLVACAVGGFVAGRQLRAHSDTPPTIRPATAAFPVAAQLSSFPGFPALAPRR